MSRPMNLLVVLLLFTATACGSDSGDSPSTTQPADSTTAGPGTTAGAGATSAPATTDASSAAFDIDPCSLLTAGEISAATGIEFGEGAINEAISRGEQSVCDWVSAGSEFATAQVLIVDGGGDQFEGNMSTAEEIFGLATEPAAVAGADRTYATAEGSIVAMDIGGTFVQVAYIPAGTENVLDATLELAAIAAGRMP